MSPRPISISSSLYYIAVVRRRRRRRHHKAAAQTFWKNKQYRIVRHKNMAQKHNF